MVRTALWSLQKQISREGDYGPSQAWRAKGEILAFLGAPVPVTWITVNSFAEYLVRLCGAEEKKEKQKKMGLLDDALAYLAILNNEGSEERAIKVYQEALRLQKAAATRRPDQRINSSGHLSSIRRRRMVLWWNGGTRK